MKRFLLLPLFLMTGVWADDPHPTTSWPEFRGHNGSGLAGGLNRPVVTWSETENVRWKTAIHGKGWSSPVVWGDQVWVTTADEVRSDKTVPVPTKGGATG